MFGERLHFASAQRVEMSWRAAGITFLTYQQLCATAVREALKEPMKAKKLATEGHHLRLMKYEGGKRTKTGKSDKRMARLGARRWRLARCALAS